MEQETVVWTATAQNIEGSTWQITITGQIADGYHIYDVVENDYVYPTTISFECGDGAHTTGEMTVLSEVHQVTDSEESYGTISGTALFSQNVELTSSSADVKVTVDYLACTDTFCTIPADTTITLHIGDQTSSEASMGVIAGISVGVALVLVAAAYAIFRKRKK